MNNVKAIKISFLFIILLYACNPHSDNLEEIAKTKQLEEYKDYCITCNDLEFALKHPDFVNSLFIHIYSKNTIDSLSEFKNLKYLKVFGENIDQYLPFLFITLSKLNHFTVLKLGDECQISRIPEEIIYLNNLESLTIENTVKHIDNNFYKLRKLRKLHIKIEGTISSRFEELQSLEELYLDVFGKNTLDEHITKLQNLKTLILPYEIEYLPPEIVNLKKLKLLDITMSKLAENEFKYYRKYHEFNVLKIVKEELPECKIEMNGNYW